ncbi:MAG: hypothetical protein J6J17_02050 [Bacilli bacterium]|nr:hypothetical protein [Bacilli bacterium]
MCFCRIRQDVFISKYSNIIDHDVTKFKYKYDLNENINFEALKATNNRIKNKDFPDNWLMKLKELMNTGNIILVPADLEIRNILVKSKIDFIFIIPDLNSEKILIERYKKRGNNKKFIERAINQLQKWHKEIPYFEYKTIILSKTFILENWLIKQKLL